MWTVMSVRTCPSTWQIVRGQQQIDVPATCLDGKIDGLPAGRSRKPLPRRIISSIESGLLKVRAGAIAAQVLCQECAMPALT